MSFFQKLFRNPGAIGIDGFIVAIGLAILLAWLVPGPGAKEGIFTLQTAAHYGISIVFFFYGVGLSP